MSDSPIEEFLAIVRRDLGARDARVLPEDESPELAQDTGDDTFVRMELPGERVLEVRWEGRPADLDARRRRLELLVSSFEGVLRRPSVLPPRPSREPASLSLHEELAALVQRAGAVSALVIDAHSPVVWSAAGEESFPHADGPQDAEGALEAERAEIARTYGIPAALNPAVDPDAAAMLPRSICERHRVLVLQRDEVAVTLAMADPHDADAVRDVVALTGLTVEPVLARDALVTSLIERYARPLAANEDPDALLAAVPTERRNFAEAARETWRRRMVSRRAVTAVRGDPAMPTLHRGGHLHAEQSGEGFGYIARSFAGIYVLIVVFDGAYEELRAKRAIAHALPAIERLMVAMPPLDPLPPEGRVVAMRRPRRR